MKSYSKYSDKKEKTTNTLVNTKRPLRILENHFVLYVGHSSNNGVLGNGYSNGFNNTFPYYRSTFKRRTLLSQSCRSSGL